MTSTLAVGMIGIPHFVTCNRCVCCATSGAFTRDIAGSVYLVTCIHAPENVPNRLPYNVSASRRNSNTDSRLERHIKLYTRDTVRGSVKAEKIDDLPYWPDQLIASSTGYQLDSAWKYIE